MPTPHNFNSSSPLLSIAIPASFIDIYPRLDQKTIQIGRIARAAAIFRVCEILVYSDVSTRKQQFQRRLISRILEYIETPQYLRKHLFSKQPELRYVGLLPPLRTSHHPLKKHVRELQQNEIREGYAFQKKKQIVVDVGVEQPLPMIKPFPQRVPDRVTVRVFKSPTSQWQVQLSQPPPQVYWGFDVIDTHHPLGAYLRHNPHYDLTIATTRTGEPAHKVWNSLSKQWHQSKRVLVLFGSHLEGLAEILNREGIAIPTIAQGIINTVPHQGVSTIRTEEAVLTSLAVLRLLESH